MHTLLLLSKGVTPAKDTEVDSLALGVGVSLGSSLSRHLPKRKTLFHLPAQLHQTQLPHKPSPKPNELH